VRLEGKAGSVVIWQGGTYHSAMPRTRAGLRISINESDTRPWVLGRNADSYIPNSPRLKPELLDRHPELKRVLGLSRGEYRDITRRNADAPLFDPYE